MKTILALAYCMTFSLPALAAKGEELNKVILKQDSEAISRAQNEFSLLYSKTNAQLRATAGMEKIRAEKATPVQDQKGSSAAESTSENFQK